MPTFAEYIGGLQKSNVDYENTSDLVPHVDALTNTASAATSNSLITDSPSTGLVSGGILSVSGSTTINIQSGTAVVSDVSNPENISSVRFSWPTVNDVTISNIGLAATTYVCFSGAINVVSITRVGSTASVTTGQDHGLVTGDQAFLYGADQVEYNLIGSATVTSPTTFDVTVTGTPSTPATGTILMIRFIELTAPPTSQQNRDFVLLGAAIHGGPAISSVSNSATPLVFQTSQTIYDILGLGLGVIKEDGGNIISGTSTGGRFNRTEGKSWFPGINRMDPKNPNCIISSATFFNVVSLTRVGSTVTAITDGDHGFGSTNLVTMTGADQGDYNGDYSITVTGPNTFEYTIGGTPTTPATGTIVASKHPVMFHIWRLLPTVVISRQDLIFGVWDDGTGGDTQPNGNLSTNSWAVHRMKFSPDANISGETAYGIEYGQKVYNTKDQALDELSIARSKFSASPAFSLVPYIASIVVRGGATDLTDTNDAEIIPATKTGEFT